ncbi:MAG: hypothetical protein C0467_25140 [Planctomycetaceae bacterium]|nr:hypothetical protein [Planctomycetaceae bacterium]
MKPLTAIASVVFALGLAGCGDTPSATEPPTSLSMTDWKAMPTDQKYTRETLERLKEGDPNLQTAEGWEVFQKTVVVPARKKDLPNVKAR